MLGEPAMEGGKGGKKAQQAPSSLGLGFEPVTSEVRCKNAWSGKVRDGDQSLARFHERERERFTWTYSPTFLGLTVPRRWWRGWLRRI